MSALFSMLGHRFRLKIIMYWHSYILSHWDVSIKGCELCSWRQGIETLKFIIIRGIRWIFRGSATRLIYITISAM